MKHEHQTFNLETEIEFEGDSIFESCTFLFGESARINFKKAAFIRFSDCRFSGSAGKNNLINTKAAVNFVHCDFTSAHHVLKAGKNNVSAENCVFTESSFVLDCSGRNTAEIKNARFEKCEEALRGFSLIENCEFLSCRRTIRNCLNVDNCQFIGCEDAVLESYDVHGCTFSDGKGCQIKISAGDCICEDGCTIEDCRFNNCSTQYKTRNREDIVSIDFNVPVAKYAEIKITGCRFDGCTLNDAYAIGCRKRNLNVLYLFDRSKKLFAGEISNCAFLNCSTLNDNPLNEYLLYPAITKNLEYKSHKVFNVQDCILESKEEIT